MAGAFLLLLALHAQDPVEVGARLTEEEIHAGETTILRVDVQTGGPRARIEGFRSLPPGIEVVGTRDYDQRQFSLPGGTRRFITREFVLRARTAGRYRIPAVTVDVEGQVYSTRSQLLTVTSAATRERGETPAAQDGVVLRAWLDADTVFVGQQVTLEVEAMFSQEARMRLRRAPEYEAPSPPAVWVHDLPNPNSSVSRPVGDDIYEVQQFRRAFFPLSAGEITIPPARLEYEMRRGLLYAPETREVTSDPIPLVVLPIPAEQPPAFTGAVGDFSLRARIEPATVPVGEAAVLTVEVEGAGNVKALPPPALPDLDGLDAFPPSEEAETEPRGSVIRGRKTFSWVLIPRRAGDVEIPAIRYAYFNPVAGAFETASVAPLSIRATPASATAAEPPAAAIRFVKTAPEGDPLAWVRSSWFAALQALPLFLLAGALIVRRRRHAPSVSASGLRRERRQELRALERRADDLDDDALFADAERFARRWLARRLGLPDRAAATPARLAAAGVPEERAEAVRSVLDRLSAARYAPTPPDRTLRRTLIGALDNTLAAIDDAAPKPRTGRPGAQATAGGPGAAGLVLAVAVTGATASWVTATAEALDRAPTGAVPVAGAAPPAVQAVAQTDAPATDTADSAAAAASAGPGGDPTVTLSTDPFAQGLEAYEAGAYGSALRSFERYTRQAPEDPAGWYNLGTSYHQVGQPGRAVWAWLRAVRLDPRDADSRHNLRVAGAAPELVRRATPAVPLRTSELILAATVLWLLTGLAGARWLLRRRRGAGVTAVVGLVLALAAAGAWWDSTRGAETLIVLDDATLRAGPALRSEAVSRLEPGTGLVPVDHYGDWVRARTLRGAEGWVESRRTGRL